MAIGGMVYFAAFEGNNGRELWKSDGTAAGTTLVKDILPGANGSNPGPFAVAGGTLFFPAQAPNMGRALWKSDGTQAGTVLVKDINPGAGPSSPTNLTVLVGVVFFNANDGASDLRGVAGRFSRDDLFTAILQPSKDISPRYRTTLVATQDGKLYQGSVIYEAVDSLILQTGPATTVRLVNNQIAARRFTDTSLMPAGLLDKLTDHEIADLYAYLKSLRSPSR